MEFKEILNLFFTVATGIATTGTFLFMLFDRKPKCEVRIKLSSDKVGDVDVPKIVITITNTGRTDIFIARTWIFANDEIKPYLVLFSPRDFREGILLSAKRRLMTDVYLEKILEEVDSKDLKQPELLLWVEVRTEIGKVYHSKKLSIPSEQIEQVLIKKAHRARL